MSELLDIINERIKFYGGRNRLLIDIVEENKDYFSHYYLVQIKYSQIAAHVRLYDKIKRKTTKGTKWSVDEEEFLVLHYVPSENNKTPNKTLLYIAEVLGRTVEGVSSKIKKIRRDGKEDDREKEQ